MHLEENNVGPSKGMEAAFKKILEEIIDHSTEGICFEAHRALKFGYFTKNEYILDEHKFENYQKLPVVDGHIYDTKKTKNNETSICKYCNQSKAAYILVRHWRTCRSKNKKNSNQYNSMDNSGQTENCDSTEGPCNNDKKEKKQVKRGKNDATMCSENMQFSKKNCGVIRRNGQPCKNSLNCKIHPKRESVLERLPEYLGDSNIDIDTVD